MSSENSALGDETKAPGATSEPFTRFSLPGLSLPLNFVPRGAGSVWKDEKWNEVPDRGEGRKLFPTALNSFDENIEGGYYGMHLTTTREFTMLHVMDALTDKPGWEEKVVFNDEIVEKWKAEAMANEIVDVTQKMANWIIAELCYKAENFKKAGNFEVYGGAVVKSDIAITSSTRTALQTAVKALEDIPEVYKDYHPGSDEKVLDLVHPSLFPLIYGRSRILPDRIIGLEDCIKSCCEGQVIEVRPNEETQHNSQDYDSSTGWTYSRRVPRWRETPFALFQGFSMAAQRCVYRGRWQSQIYKLYQQFPS